MLLSPAYARVESSRDRDDAKTYVDDFTEEAKDFSDVVDEDCDDEGDLPVAAAQLALDGSIIGVRLSAAGASDGDYAKTKRIGQHLLDLADITDYKFGGE